MWFEISSVDIGLICAFLLCFVFIVATLIRVWIKLTHVRFASNVNLKGKTVLITGANSGIGRETARYMAKRGARVIMACRTMETAKTVRDEIAAESENSNIILHQLDLSSFQSIRDFCAAIIETETKIDILIHNAGYGGLCRRAVSADGIEYTMATNHYGPFLMTSLLMDFLKKSAPCRIIIVSSKAHTVAFLNPTKEEDLNPLDYWFPLVIYSNSKLANLLFTFELARRLEGTDVTVNALHPGTIDTEIYRNLSFPLKVVKQIFRIFLRTIDEGIQTTLHVALSTSLDSTSGQYFRDCRVGKTSKNAQNIEWQKIMWEQSMKMTRLNKNDPKI